MPKKVSEIQIKEMVDDFKNGKNIEELSKKFNCTKITITRHLKNNLSESEFKKLLQKSNSKQKNIKESKKYNFTEVGAHEEFLNESESGDISLIDSTFVEIAPLNYEIDVAVQKDLSSVPLSEIDFPNVVYMIVDNKIELETKLLKEYPEWQFLSENELNRKTIEIFFDIKIAKRFCKKEQKVIKVPNTDVFRITRDVLISKGISRIVSSDKLIAL